MHHLALDVGSFHFIARLEKAAAPHTCAAFLQMLPYTNHVIHSRWSGEAVWVPMGDFDTGLGFENHTNHPSRGDVLLYPGGFSETEILFAYGSSQFASKMGQLAGNHFLTVVEGTEQLMEMGRSILWKGAQTITFSDLGER
ncbi:DUF3830 family protein [Azoarcus sp. L1K30]|uniref:DUF3830 family protein n=1 Tax=Azoarcus sp. L1K30 TaxID=2820277 RepID=UPI001B827676|nr:DUF3830 family protein [Azoarcus sp. L1K30]MBR0565539.1 DUF3830 family protein [Azoarcus sp. L1K30]